MESIAKHKFIVATLFRNSQASGEYHVRYERTIDPMFYAMPEQQLRGTKFFGESKEFKELVANQPRPRWDRITGLSQDSLKTLEKLVRKGKIRLLRSAFFFSIIIIIIIIIHDVQL